MTNHTEAIAVGATEDGTVVFYDPNTPASIRRLGPAPSNLHDLTGYVRIPTLSAFVRELLSAEQDASETGVQP